MGAAEISILLEQFHMFELRHVRKYFALDANQAPRIKPRESSPANQAPLV
jgi:hypothetical protein